MEMNRIDDLIASLGITTTIKAIDGFIAFCEGEMTLVDGSDLTCLDSFKLGPVFHWFYFEE